MVNIRNGSRFLEVTNTTKIISQTEFIHTGLQCATYTITVVVTGETTEDLGGKYSLQYGTVQVLVWGKAIVQYVWDFSKGILIIVMSLHGS